ncbi:thioredoxin family protein, partial [Klebsiella pneumoniae]|nr:thioredoxin family protein [Klebsiella pneumoniae]
RYTPTFILVDGGREIGRIEGYPGADFFWGLLERLAQRLPPQS